MKYSQKCPDCGCKKLQLKTDGIVCMKCGLVISDTYFSGSEAVR